MVSTGGQQQQHHDSLFLRRDDDQDMRGEYGLVNNAASIANGGDDDEEEDYLQQQQQQKSLSSSVMQAMEVDGVLHQNDDDEDQRSSSSSSSSPWYRTFFTPLFPDDRLYILDKIQLMDSVEGVRLFKFFAFTWIGLIGMFYFVRLMEFENDTSYTIPDMIVYDGQPILMDTMFFFVVGRLYKQKGIDHIAWMGTAIASGLFSSMETVFPFLQASVTLYSMHCLWGISTWIFAISIVGICALVVLLHIRTLFQQEQMTMKIFELTLCILLFLLPMLTSPYFHFHHWFAGWLIGMHANIDIWWSRLTMAWCWGAYINGIAVYGRDPLLTCGYSFYLSYSSHCPYLKCYLDGMRNHTTHKMEAQDWRNCSAADYLP